MYHESIQEDIGHTMMSENEKISQEFIAFVWGISIFVAIIDMSILLYFKFQIYEIDGGFVILMVMINAIIISSICGMFIYNRHIDLAEDKSKRELKPKQNHTFLACIIIFLATVIFYKIVPSSIPYIVKFLEHLK